MTNSAPVFDTALDAVSTAADALPTELEAVKGLDDRALLTAQRRLAQARARLDACASLVAGEVGYRSRRELGYTGLAQREGFRTPESLVQHTTGSTAREATTLVQVGTMVHDAMTAPDTGSDEVREPWLAAVARAVTAGTLSVGAARAIRTGLGEPNTGPGTADPDGVGVTREQLAGAAATLLEEATSLNVDELFKRARQLRDDLDRLGIADRERALYKARALRRVRRANGLSRYILDPDLETAAWLDDVYDKLTSPRRGGPRFVDPADQAWAKAIIDDDRSTEQYVHDAFTTLLRLGVDADQNDSHKITGSRAPAVRILISADALTEHTGPGRIEGSDTPVSIDTVERTICTSGTLAIAFDTTGQPVDLGREARLFTPRQKIALAARDGGCMWGNCDRPPAWTEAHHINQWKRDHGRTDVADGILLCRYHHLLLHNNHWEIFRRDGLYWLVPPSDVDPAQSPRPLPSKSAALNDLRADRRRRDNVPPDQSESETPAETDSA